MQPERVENRLSTLGNKLAAIPEAEQSPRTTLDILERSKRERNWHNLLAYFIDPDEPHGFESDVLEKVLQAIQDNSTFSFTSVDVDECDIHSEVAGPEGRPDLAIMSGREWFVLIELKVTAEEGSDQTHRYVRDDRIGEIPKQEFPPDGHNYVYLSGAQKPDADASEFIDIAWSDIIDAIEPLILTSRGRYPAKSLAQLTDFLDTIKEEMNLTEDRFTENQRKKIELYGEYQDAIEDARAAFDDAIEDAQANWYDRFLAEYRPKNWSDEWNCSPTVSGQIYREGWRLDSNLERTDSVSKEGTALQFVHYIREDELLRQGKLKFQLKWGGNADKELRDRFADWFARELAEGDLNLEAYGITVKEKAGVFTEKVYEFDVSDFPDSYYAALRRAFEEHQVVVDFISERDELREIVQE